MIGKNRRYDAQGKISKTLSGAESILGKKHNLNAIEEKFYDKTDRWFFLQSLYLNLETKVLTVRIRPNDDVHDMRTFIFSEVSDFQRSADDEQEPENFPQQIFGIDYSDKLNNLYAYTIACDEAEYSFIASGFPKKI